MGYEARQTGGGNATVPNDAPILPVQAFVDAMIVCQGNGIGSKNIILSNSGIVSIDPIFFDAVLEKDEFNLQLNGNALTISAVNAVLAYLASDPGLNGTLDLSGGTNAAPTGQGITDKNTLIANGWTVTTN